MKERRVILSEKKLNISFVDVRNRKMKNCGLNPFGKVFPDQIERASVKQTPKALYHYDVNNDTDFMFNFEREFYVAVQHNVNLTKSDLIEFTLNINDDTVTSVVSRNNCVINCTSNGYCVYNIPDITTDAVKDGPVVVDIEVDGGFGHCAAGILVTDDVIETSLDLSGINVNDVTVITDSGEYPCSQIIRCDDNSGPRYQLRSDEFGKSEMSLVKWAEIHKKRKSSSNGEIKRNNRTRPLETTSSPPDNEEIQIKKSRTSNPLTDFRQYSEEVRSFSHQRSLPYLPAR